MASCTVAEPSFARPAAAAGSARLMLRYTTPSSNISKSFRFQLLVQQREHAARVAFVDGVLVLGAEDLRGLDVAPGVVVVVPAFRVDAAHGADHLGGEQHVLHRD